MERPRIASMFALVVVGASVWWCSRTTTAPRPSAAPTASAEPAFPILNGLRVGNDVEGWKVTKIWLVGDATKQIAIELDQGGSGLTVWVGRKSEVENPPIATERHAITHGDPRLYGDPIPDSAFELLAKAVAERVRAAERDPGNDL